MGKSLCRMMKNDSNRLSLKSIVPIVESMPCTRKSDRVPVNHREIQRLLSLAGGAVRRRAGTADFALPISDLGLTFMVLGAVLLAFMIALIKAKRQVAQPKGGT